MCAKDKQTATENFKPVLIFYRLGKKSEKSYGGVAAAHPVPLLYVQGLRLSQSLSGKPPSRSHLPVPRVWPHGGSTVR